MYYFTRQTPFFVFCEKILDLLFPMGTYCICCGKYIDISRPYCLCDQCMAALNWGHISIDLARERKERGRTRHLDSALSCMVYGLHSKRLIFDLKYNRKTFMSRPISMIMADRLTSDESLSGILRSLDLVVPVPIHGSKLKKRGFNQAALISSDLTVRLDHCGAAGPLIHIPDCLLRTRATQAQRSITGNSRFANLEGAFAFNPGYSGRLTGKSVHLVDDILTTGATADHCARILKENGASSVHLITLATGNYYLEGSFRPRDDREFLNLL